MDAVRGQKGLLACAPGFVLRNPGGIGAAPRGRFG